MDTAVTISPQHPVNRGLDYAYLKARGVRLAQRLSSKIWTDYNEHDPGVTTIEQLCYALTELSYRAELPVADLLAQPLTGRIEARNHGLFTPRHILPCSPVSINDYRKLIADRVPGVANVWLTPLIPPSDSKAVNGLYNICVYCPEANCDPNGGDHRERTLRQVRRVYNRYRNLCEDLHAVRMLVPHRTVVFADVNIRGRQRVEQIMANILFGVGDLLAPELRRRPLSDLLRAGETPDEIFNGPLLRRGFISDDQLQPKFASAAVNDIVQAIAGVEGVIGVQNVVASAGGQRYAANSAVPVPAGAYLHLDVHPQEEGRGFPIRLFLNGMLCRPDPGTVARELNALWTKSRRSYPLEMQYEEYFGTPRGQWHDLESYYSIQNQYPGIYGIGAFGLPADVTDRRRAQARQLKGYLLPFEQLMANYFAQLSQVGNLFTIKPEPWRTYYGQSLEKSVPDVMPVLASDYREGLAAIVSNADDMLERRNHFAGFLLSLYANDLYADRSGGESIPRNGQDAGAKRSIERLLRARLEFARVLPTSTRRRGAGFDYRAEPSFHNVAGMELKCRIEMGLDVDRHLSFTDALAKSDVKLAESHAELLRSRSAALHFRHFEERFRPVAEYEEPHDIPEFSSFLKGIEVTAELIAAAQELDNLFVGSLPNEERVTLVCRTPTGAWIVIGVHEHRHTVLREAHALCRQLKEIHRARTQFYIVEHTLLRVCRRKDQARDRFQYSFTLTAVVGLPAPELRNEQNRTVVEEIVRANTPALIVADVCFLDPWHLLEFEHLYWAWRTALRRRKGCNLRRTSAHLRRFLEHHCHSTTKRGGRDDLAQS